MRVTCKMNVTEGGQVLKSPLKSMVRTLTSVVTVGGPVGR